MTTKNTKAEDQTIIISEKNDDSMDCQPVGIGCLSDPESTDPGKNGQGPERPYF